MHRSNIFYLLKENNILTVVNVGPGVKGAHGQGLRIESSERVDDVCAKSRVKVFGHEFSFALPVHRPRGDVTNDPRSDLLELELVHLLEFSKFVQPRGLVRVLVAVTGIADLRTSSYTSTLSGIVKTTDSAVSTVKLTC